METLTRDHKHRNLYFADASTGQVKLMLQQQDDKFLDDKYDVSVADQRIILTGWMDGHTHIYLYSFDAANPMASEAKLEKQLTQGDFDVDEVLGVDAARKQVYYASNEGHPAEQQLWRVSFRGERKPITTEPGFHAGDFAPTGGAVVDRHSDRLTPTSVSLCNVDGPCHLFWSTKAMEAYHLRAPEPLEVKASDGSTLYATILLPADKIDPASVPLIVNPYGGPGVMTIQNKWGGDGFLFEADIAARIQFENLLRHGGTSGVSRASGLVGDDFHGCD